MSDEILSLLIVMTNGEEIEIRIKSSATVKELKEMIAQKMDSIYEICVYFEQQYLPDMSLLKSLNIGNYSVLHTICRHIGGGSINTSKAFNFFNVSEAKMVQSKVGDFGNIHLTVVSGLNLECKCTNEDCKFYDKRVICPLGQVNFDFFDKENNYKKTKCPICHKCTYFKNCGFYKCKYQFIGQKVDSKTRIFQDIDTTRYTTNGYYECFDDSSDKDNVQWLSLKVEIDTSVKTNENGEAI